MSSFEDLLILPNLTNLNIQISYPKLPPNNSNTPYKIKRINTNKPIDGRYFNENIFQTLQQMKKVLNSAMLSEEKKLNNNYM